MAAPADLSKLRIDRLRATGQVRVTILDHDWRILPEMGARAGSSQSELLGKILRFLAIVITRIMAVGAQALR